MNTGRRIPWLLLLFPLLLTGCVRELWPEADASEWVIPFGAPPSTEVVVSTKGTLTSKVESSINNIYVFIFDSNGNKIFGQLFDESNKGAATLPNYWTSTTDDTGATDGVIHLKTEKVSGCKIVAICNIDAEMIDLSPEYLGTIANYSQIQGLKVTLNQLTLSRNGNFPMVAESPSNSSETVGFNTETTPSYSGSLTFRRLDAKIKFTVRAEAGYNINNFTPTSWQVVNVPKVSYVLPHIVDNIDVDAASTAQDFFDSEATVFETETLQSDESIKYVSGRRIPIHGFSFYMMENRKAPLAHEGSWTYADRELQNKSTGAFVYADPLATYVIITGRLETKDGTTTTMAEVRYVIHLGDFGDHGDSEHAANADFDVKRNHTYTYNIYIRGAEHIKVEVQDDAHPENEPGATGDILISEGGAITCDSHYSTHSLVFYKDKILPNKMNWWVMTPFNPDGADPKEVNLSGIDYKWVEFRVNEKGASGYVKNKWTRYLPHGKNPDPSDSNQNPTMYINELLAYLSSTSADFDNTQDKKIVVTAFVNEYYYETNPLTGQYEADLWKKFVNQPMRTMCILSEVKASPDKESHVVSSSFTIQQHSIQTVYNINSPDLKSGWGGEYMTDDREALCKQYWETRNNATDKDGLPGKRQNNNPKNGRRDTMIEWGLMGKTPNSYAYVGDNNVPWNKYLNLEDDDSSIPFMTKSSPIEGPAKGQNYAYLRYSCMSRNRDNDGDGKIDRDEIRWYMATSSQLVDLFLGSRGIEGAARLYHRDPEKWERKADGTGVRDTWREHVLGSNCVNSNSVSNNEVRIVWAEEGITGSSMAYTGSADQTSTFSVRCVRNFGTASNGDDITFADENVVPDDLIIVKSQKNGQDYTPNWSNSTDYNDVYFDVDCSRVNEKSLRYYTDRELLLHDENAEESCLYKHFVTNSIQDSKLLDTDTSVQTMNNNIDNPNNTIQYCPDGYRLPNIRELAIIYHFLSSDELTGFLSGNKIFARTFFSLGVNGEGLAHDKHWGWGIRKDGNTLKAFMGSNTNFKTTSTRCVKDVKVVE